MYTKERIKHHIKWREKNLTHFSCRPNLVKGQIDGFRHGLKFIEKFEKFDCENMSKEFNQWIQICLDKFFSTLEKLPEHKKENDYEIGRYFAFRDAIGIYEQEVSKLISYYDYLKRIS